MAEQRGMEMSGKIDWKKFTSDEQISEQIKKLVREVPINRFEAARLSPQDIAAEIAEYIDVAGFPTKVYLDVSKEDAQGKRTIKGKANSPISDSMIDF